MMRRASASPKRGSVLMEPSIGREVACCRVEISTPPDLAEQGSEKSPLRTGNALEERVTEHAIGFGSAMQRTNASIECDGIDDLRLYRRVANALDHRGERPPREPINEMRTARIDVDHAGRHARRRVPGLHQQWVELPSHQRIATAAALQLDLARDHSTRLVTIRVEVSGAMVTLEHRDRAAAFEQVPQDEKRVNRLRHVFENEAHEDVVERPQLERQREEIRLLELDVREARCVDGRLRRRE